MTKKLQSLEKKGSYGIINFTDDLIEKGLGTRKIAKMVREKFKVDLSFMSIVARKKDLQKMKQSFQTATKEPNYKVIIRPMNYNPNKATWQDKAILRALNKKR